jgi:hypothetical protein
MRAVSVIGAAIVAAVMSVHPALAKAHYCGGKISEDRNAIFVSDDLADDNAPVCILDKRERSDWRRIREACPDDVYCNFLGHITGRKAWTTLNKKNEYHIDRVLRIDLE